MREIRIQQTDEGETRILQVLHDEEKELNLALDGTQDMTILLNALSTIMVGLRKEIPLKESYDLCTKYLRDRIWSKDFDSTRLEFE